MSKEALNAWTYKHIDNFNHFLKEVEATADTRHGSPWDRGGADYYYGRNPNPHFFEGAPYATAKFEKENMTDQQIDEYFAGYVWMQRTGAEKSWN